MKITVIGCGRWGSFIAWYLNSIGQDVVLYGRKGSKNMERFMKERRNDYLKLPDTLTLSYDLEQICTSDAIVISINSQGLQNLMDELKVYHLNNKKIILCMKGIEIATGRRLTQIVEDNLDESNKTAVWLGPGHVQEFIKGTPNCMVIDSDDQNTKEVLVNQFSSPLIRFYYGQDLIGNEIGGALKNVIGIAAGMLDGLGLRTLKGALMSRGTREVARLIKAMGGNELSAYGLAHLGDYEATLFSKHSQNRMFGESFITGRPYEKLAEGVATVKALMKLSEEYNVEMPISHVVYDIIYNNYDPKDALPRLFGRDVKGEFATNY